MRKIGIGYLRQNIHTLWKFALIGAFTMCIQISLQKIELAHGYNIFWWSFFQGSILANLGMAVNKQWTYKDRSLPWLWAIFCWNIQKIPHSALSMAVFGLLLQVSFLPFWGPTVLTTGALGLGSFFATNWFVGQTAAINRWAAILFAAYLIASYRQTNLEDQMA